MDLSTHPPRLNQAGCLNALLSPTARSPEAVCQRCVNVCPASAIALHDAMPTVDEHACTGCAGCVGVCPTSAISHPHLRAEAWLERANDIVATGRTRLMAACPAVPECRADIHVPCHAAWDVTMLAALAARGVRTLALAGLHACEECPMRHGRRMLARAQQDYATLNHALGVKLRIEESTPETGAGAPTAPDGGAAHAAGEPPRRAFFRRLLPMLAENAAAAAAQISQTAREAVREASQDDSPEPDAPPRTSAPPPRLGRFLRALPHLRINFTPVPPMDALPLGAIQASDACTACGDCIPACPTQALSLKPFGPNRILEFRPNACIGCRHCIAVCPAQALEPLPALSLPAVAAARPRPLIMVRATESNATWNRED